MARLFGATTPMPPTAAVAPLPLQPKLLFRRSLWNTDTSLSSSRASRHQGPPPATPPRPLFHIPGHRGGETSPRSAPESSSGVVDSSVNFARATFHAEPGRMQPLHHRHNASSAKCLYYNLHRIA